MSTVPQHLFDSNADSNINQELHRQVPIGRIGKTITSATRSAA